MSSSVSEDKQVKKRNRLTLSCINCKKRKVKCDRGHPCSSCIRYKLGQNCIYPDTQWAGPVYPNEESNGLKHMKNNFGSASFLVQRLNGSSNQQQQGNIIQDPMFNQSPISNEILNQNQNQNHQIQNIEITPPPALQSELEMLKSKIKAIEASLQGISPPNSQPINNNGIVPSNNASGYSSINNGIISSANGSGQHQPTTSNSLVQPPKNNGNLNLPNQVINEMRSNSIVGMNFNPSATQSIISSRSNSVNGIPPIHDHSQSNHFCPKPDLANYTLSSLAHFKENVPIQLPPINWKPNNQGTSKIEPKSSGTFPGIINWDSLKFDPNDKKHYIGTNPYVSNEETLDLYSGYSPIHIREARRMNYGPFSFLSIMKKDKGLLKMLQFMMSKRFEKLRDKVAGGQNLMDSKTDQDDSKFRKTAMDREGLSDLIAYRQARENNLAKSIQLKQATKQSILYPSNGSNPSMDSIFKSKMEKAIPAQAARENANIYMNKHAISLGLTFYEGKLDQELHLIEKLKLIIPKQKVIWLLINRFFVSIYPYMPFVDEEDFKKQMARIIGPEDYTEKAVDVKVEIRLDFAYMGILLLILRLVYLSLLSNKNSENEANLNTEDKSPKAQELKYLLSNPISISIVDMAKLCLDQFDLFQKSNLVIVQFALFMRIYNMCSPEDGDGADGVSQIFNGTLIQMAHSIGINREPEKFEEFNDFKKTNNITRKMWHFLVADDIAEAYQYGNPIGIERQYYDTKLPYYEPGNGNCADDAIEQNVVSTYSYFEQYHTHVLKILKICLNIQTPVNIGLLVKYVSEFEILLHENYGTIDQFLTKFDSEKYGFPFIKVLKCRNYIHMKFFLNLIFFQLYLHYELKNQSEYAYFYLKKSFVSSAFEFVPEIFKLIFRCREYFGESSELIMNPVFESLTHKTNQITLTLMIKINCEIYALRKNEAHRFKLSNDPEYKLKFSRLLKVSKTLEAIFRHGVSALSRFSNRYYYAWRVTKAHTFLLSLATSEDFYKFFDAQGGKKSLDLNLEQISELSTICDASFHKISKLKFFNKISKENLPSEVFGKIATADEYRILVEQPRINEDTDIVSSAHSHEDSTSTSLDLQDLEESQIIENADIDRLWYQMANLKNGAIANGGTYENYKFNENSDVPPEQPIIPSENWQEFSNEYGTAQPKLAPQSPTNFYPDTAITPINHEFFSQFSFNPVFDVFGNFLADTLLDPAFDSTPNSRDRGFLLGN